MLVSRKKQSVSTGTQSLQTVKQDRNLFSSLFISCQNRQCDLNECFRHENQNSPPSLSQNGQMHQGTNSQLLPLLEEEASDILDTAPTADVIIVDGTAFVNAVRRTKGSTFESYAQNEVLPKVQKYTLKHKQTHIVFDIYRTDSM